jgi:hypothetical protein
MSYLKTKDEVLNEDKFDKAALISTAEGKTITSTYLAKRAEMLEIGETITLDIDSEMHLTPCKCDIKPCTTTASISPDITMLTQDSWLWRPVLYSMSQSTCDISASPLFCLKINLTKLHLFQLQKERPLPALT